MRWHFRLSHFPFAKLNQLAKFSKIPRQFTKVAPPKCAGCIYGMMTKVPWRNNKQTHKIFVATKPGECISVDQMISTQVSFVAQLKGRLSTQRYRAATIFMDHFSRLLFIYLMQSLSFEETLAAKSAFERFAAQHGITIRHYHATTDNLPITSLSHHATKRSNNSLFVESTPIFKMESPSRQFGTSLNRLKSNYSTLNNDGKQQSIISPYGLTCSGVPASYTTVCLSQTTTLCA